MKILGFRRLLGLAAIGGGIYWMQKKRGGDMTFASIKENFRGVIDDVLNKTNQQGANDQQSIGDTGAPTSGTGSTRQSFGGSSGYSGSAGTYTGTGTGYGGSSGSGGFGGSGFGGSKGGGGTRH